MIKETNQHWLDVASHMPRLLRSRWPRTFPLTGLSFGFRVLGVKPGFVTRIDIRKLGSLVAFSWRSKQTSSRCSFWSTLRSLGTNFDATRRIFKSSVNILWQVPWRIPTGILTSSMVRRRSSRIIRRSLSIISGVELVARTFMRHVASSNLLLTFCDKFHD